MAVKVLIHGPTSDLDGSIGWQVQCLNWRYWSRKQSVKIMGNRLYVGNLAFSADSETVRAAFAEVGEVTDVHLVTDRSTGQSRGFAFVTMGTNQLAAEAISRLDGTTIDGRALRVNEAEERKGGGGGGGFGGGGGGGGGGGSRRNDRSNRW